jgi:hypothetical protein
VWVNARYGREVKFHRSVICYLKVLDPFLNFRAFYGLFNGLFLSRKDVLLPCLIRRSESSSEVQYHIPDYLIVLRIDEVIPMDNRLNFSPQFREGL